MDACVCPNEHYVLLQTDFLKRKKNALPEYQATANSELPESYNKNGVLPFIVLLDSEGKLLGETGYKKTSAEDYIEELNEWTI